MAGGTRVGQAYVALTADGSGINNDIVGAFDDVDYDGLGREHRKEYADAFNKHMEKDLGSSLDRSLKNIKKAFDTDDTLKKSVSRMVSIADEQGDLTNLYRRVARDAGVTYTHEFEDVIRPGVRKALENSLKDAARNGANKDLMADLVRSFSMDDGDSSFLLPGGAVDKMVADVKRGLEQSKKEYERHTKEYTKLWTDMLDEREALEKANAEVVDKFIVNREKLIEDSNAAILKSDQMLVKEQTAIIKQREKEHRQSIANTIKDAKRAGREAVDILKEVSAFEEEEAEERDRRSREAAEAQIKRERDIAALRMRFDRSGRGSLGDNLVGRLFGRGSRNNFLNLLGSVMGNVVGLTQRAGEFASVFAKGMMAAGEGASIFARFIGGLQATGLMAIRGGGGLVAMFTNIAVAAPMAAVVITVVTVALSAMVSVVSALVGILTVLLSTITSALVGALAVFGGALVAVTASAGLLVNAFMSMDDAQKRILKNKFAPLKTELVGIGQTMMKDMVPAFGEWADNLSRALDLLRPIAEVMGTAFADAGNSLTAAFSGPGFQKLSEALTEWLPSITTNLSSALGGFLNGLAGMFAAIMPLVSQFAEYLNRTANRFSEWANSAAGQNAIVDFVGRAVESLKSLWGFLREFSGFLSDILFSASAQEAGNTLFDDLRDSFQRFRDAIADGRLEQWFEDAKDFAEDLGTAIVGLSEVFGNLYNSGVLQGVGNAIAFIGDVMEDLAPIIGFVVGAVTGLIRVFSNFINGVLTPFTDGLSNLGELLEWVRDKISKLFKFGGKIRSFGPINLLTGIVKLLVGFAEDAIGMVKGFFQLSGSIPILGPLNSLLGVIGNIRSAAEAAIGVLNTLLRKNNSTPAYMGPPGQPRDYGGDAGDTGGGALGGATIGSMRSTIGRTATTAARAFTPTLPNVDTTGMQASPSPSLTVAEAKKKTKKWVNPWKKWARSLIKEGPGIAAEVRKSIKSINRMIRVAMREASRAEGAADARSAINDTIRSAREAARATVQSVRDALNDAARDLANASNPKEARRALKRVKRLQDLMTKARKDLQKTIKVTDRMKWQRTVRPKMVQRLMNGVNAQHATLAEYAVARARVAKKLEEANQQLVDAIAMRADYREQISNAIRDFGNLTTAEAKTVDGVEQALTATDITDNLRERLAKIRKFQENLRLLVSQGLSNEAYKQLLDAGVDEGGEFAEALVQGGQGAITETNNLISAIGKAGDKLGLAASSRLYDAGVEAARGLVEGLESLSDKLDNAATRLGNRIAAALKRQLGIKSPSKVTQAMMDDVGDGAVIGLDSQHTKVGAAASRLAEQIQVSPEVANYAARQGTSATGDSVSGNGKDPRFRDLVVNTPTENPKAVAMEVLNEVTGRL